MSDKLFLWLIHIFVNTLLLHLGILVLSYYRFRGDIKYIKDILENFIGSNCFTLKHMCLPYRLT